MSPTIRIDEEVYAQLQSQAVPFVDTPNSVLRRVLGLTPENASEESQPDEGNSSSRQNGRQLSPPATRRKARGKDRKERAAPGTILSEDEYEIPLLTVLMDNGGSAPASEVIDELGRRLDGRLMSKDHERLRSGRIRWHNRAQFVRLRLVEEGFMKKDSPRGIWEISDQGRDRVAKGSS